MSDKRDGYPASGATRTRHAATAAIRGRGPVPSLIVLSVLLLSLPGRPQDRGPIGLMPT